MILDPPPEDLEGFPSYPLRRGTPLYKVHLTGNTPWWYTNHPSLRFSLPHPQGTLHASRTVEAAFDIAFGPASAGTKFVSEPQAQRFSISTMAFPKAKSLASFIAPKASVYSATKKMRGKIATARLWAVALMDSGFDGTLHGSRFSGNSRGNTVAIFGPAGVPNPLPPSKPQPIYASRSRIRDSNWFIFPLPPKSQLTLI
jgi:hypothetical protein